MSSQTRAASSLRMGLRDDAVKNVVLDLHGIILRWPKESATWRSLLNPKIFKAMIHDHLWGEYELGRLSSDEVYGKFAQKFAVPAENIKEALRLAQEQLVPVPEIINIINEFRGKVRFFCLTNCPKSEFAITWQKFPEIWSAFERTFIPVEVGCRKPDLNSFKFVIHEANLDPKQTVFVDDDLQNCIAAKSLGMTTIHCENMEAAVQSLYFYIRSEDERIAAARKYLDRVLESEQHHLLSEVKTGGKKGPSLTDNFSEFYIAEVLDDERFLPDIPIPENYELHYSRASFEEMLKWTFYPLPRDLDTTSVALSVLYRFEKISFEYVRKATEHMLEFVSEDGIMQTYFDISRRRTDPFVIANISLLFHYAQRPLPPASVEFLRNLLLNGAYLDGSQYYIGPAPVLFFLSKTARRFRDNHRLWDDFIPLLTSRVRENMGTETDPLACAMMVLACLNLQIEPDVRDLEKLSMAQKADGSWELCYFLRGNVIELGCRALTAAFALSAMERTRQLRLKC